MEVAAIAIKLAKFYVLEVLGELPVTAGMFSIAALGYGSRWPLVASKQLENKELKP